MSDPLIWARAVVLPAWRRAAGVWVGAAIAGGIVFGPTGMQPADLTRLAVGVPAIGAGLALTWLLVFVPAARVLVHAEGARYLRSLPGPRWPARVIAVVAFLVLQLPWLALWLLGDGVRGLAIVVGLSLVIALVAAWQPRPRIVHFPPWTRPYPALRGIYLRALKRRAGDALVRGIGLALLAGLVAALVVRNNGLAGESAALLGSGVIAIVLIPGWAGALLPLVEAQRASTWLASSLGMSALLRVAVLATVVVGVYIAGTLVALIAATVGFHEILDHAASTATLVWLCAVALVTAIGMGLVTTRALVIAERQLASSDRTLVAPVRDVAGAPMRVVSGAVTASALAVLCLAWLGVIGVPILVGIGLCLLLTARPA